MSRISDSPKELKPPWYPWIGKRPFYGWIIVIIGAVTQFFQGVASQGFSTYLSPLGSDFGWSKAALAAPRSITMIEGAITGPFEGFLVDRFGPRRVVSAGIFVMGLGFILFGIMDSYWMFYVSSMVIALGMGMQGLLVMSVTVNNWFRRKRTISQSVMGLGYSMAGVVGVPALVLIQNGLGWRASCYITAAVIWAFGFPMAMLLRTGPESVGSVPDGGAAENKPDESGGIEEEYDFTLSDALKTPAFWLIAFGWAIGNIGLLGVQVHLFLHLEWVGIARETVSLVWMVASLANIPSRLAGGFFGDRLPKNVMLAASMVLMAVAVYILAVATTPVMAFTYAVLFGIGWGMRTPIVNAIQGEYFGRKSQGIIRGWLQTISLPIGIAAPIIAGYMADLQGTYTPTFIGMALVTLVGALLVFLAKKPKPPSSMSRLLRN